MTNQNRVEHDEIMKEDKNNKPEITVNKTKEREKERCICNLLLSGTTMTDKVLGVINVTLIEPVEF